MKNYLFSLLLFATAVNGQNLSNQVNIGGTGDDDLTIHKMNDGSGYYLFGRSTSNISGNKVEDSKGVIDYWLLKTDNDFSIEWDKTIGGSASNFATDALVSGAGIFVLGYSNSDISGDKTMDSYGHSDIWLLYIADDGSIVWQQQYGGDLTDLSVRMIEYTDTSLLVLTNSASDISGNKTVASIGGMDIWLLEVSKYDGTVIQQKVIGTESSDRSNILAKNPYNNHIYIGAQTLFGISGDKSEYGYGAEDAWLIELDENLNIVNEKVYGGSNMENYIKSFVFHEDYIYALTDSQSEVSGNKTAPFFSAYDFLPDVWLLKLNYDLSIVWDKSYGGSGGDYGSNILALPNGNLVITTSSKSVPSGNKTTPSYGISYSDVWMVVIQPDGEIVYQESFGGSLDDFGYLYKGNNDEFILCSYSNSPVSGNKTVPTWGGVDSWLGKIDLETILSSSTVAAEQFELFPNPATAELFVNGTFSSTSFHIIDMTGKEVMTGNIQDTQLKIDVASLQSGMYLLQIDERQFKFVKQ